MAKTKKDEKKDEEKKPKKESVIITPPDIREAHFLLEGTAPLVINKFPKKAREMMMEAMMKGGQKSKKKEPRDFDAEWIEAARQSDEGWYGLPAPGFRKGLISACRLCGFKMTLAKMSLFIKADGLDKDDRQPLVKITKGEPVKKIDYVKNAGPGGVIDLRARAMWEPGWQADLCVQYDHDQFSVEDVANLLMRVGIQVGMGAGRHDSTNSAGMGWGTFMIMNPEEPSLPPPMPKE